MEMAVILLGMLLMLILVLKRVHVCIAALAAAAFIALCSGMDVMEVVTDGFLSGVGEFLSSVWLMILLGGILSRLMDVSGAARSLAGAVTEMLGKEGAIPSIILAGALLTYGGVSSMVTSYALYPIALAVFRKADLPERLIPAAVGSGIFTWVTMLPGNPSVQNIIPTEYLGTTPMAAPAVGIGAALVTFVLQVLYFRYETGKAKKRGVHFVEDERVRAVLADADKLEQEGRLPGIFCSVLPIVSIAAALNLLKMDISAALMIGILLCLILFRKNFKGKPLTVCLSEAVNRSASAAIGVSSIVGLGSAVKLTPGFDMIVSRLIGFIGAGGNTLAVFAIATTLLCGLNASGMGGLSTVMSAMGDTFLGLGIDPDILHRIAVIASAGLDSLPHSGGIVTLLTISGISYKEGYGPLFISTVVTALIALAAAVLMGNILY